MKIPFLAWVFQVIPECLATATLTISMCTASIPLKTVLKVGLLQAVCTYLVRLLPFTPGVHVIILAATLGVLCIYFAGVDIKRGLAFSAVTMAALVILEFLSVYTVVSIGGLDIDKILSNNATRIAFGYPHIILLFLLAFLFKKKILSLNFLFNKKDEV